MTKLKVWGWQADSAGCGTYRVRWPADAVTKHYGDRVEIRHDTNMSKENRDWDPDVIVGQRVVLEGPSRMWQEWRRQGKVLITELDDSLWEVPESNLRASAVFNARGMRRRLEENIAASDWITVTTQALRETVHRNTGFPLDRILIIPNAVPPELVVDTVPDPESHRFSLGYLASQTHGEDFKMVKRHLLRLLENDTGLTFASVGADYAKELRMPERTFHRGWDPSPAEAIRSIDYGLSMAPLLPGTFNRSKSDCKYVEASARGVASIVSDVTAYDPVKHNVTGVKVRREHEWGKALRSLLESPDERLRLATAAHAEVAEHRTTDVTAHQWYEAFTRGRAT